MLLNNKTILKKKNKSKQKVIELKKMTYKINKLRQKNNKKHNKYNNNRSCLKPI